MRLRSPVGFSVAMVSVRLNLTLGPFRNVGSARLGDAALNVSSNFSPQSNIDEKM